MKEISKGIPYILGAFVIFPLILWGVNFFFFSGNKVDSTVIDQYITSSDLDTIKLPPNTEEVRKQYDLKLSKYGTASAFLYRVIFFHEPMNKYLSALTFSKFEQDDHAYDRVLNMRDDKTTVLFMINKAQMRNPRYGTKENPLPVFPLELLSGDSLNMHSKESFRISASLNHIFVEQYLKYFMPKKEFKKMFGSK